MNYDYAMFRVFVSIAVTLIVPLTIDDETLLDCATGEIQAGAIVANSLVNSSEK